MRGFEHPLGQAGDAIVRWPVVHEIAVRGHPLAEASQEARDLAVLAGQHVNRVPAQRHPAAVLIALPAHAVYEGLLRGIAHGVRGGIEHSLHHRIRGDDTWLVRPRILAFENAGIGNNDTAAPGVQMHLHPAEAVEVEPAEMVYSVAAGEAHPLVVAGIHQCRTSHGMTVLRHHFERCARGSLDRDARPADPLLRQRKCQRRAALGGQLEPPGILTGGLGCLRDLGIVGLGRAHGEVFGDRPLPLDAVLLDQRRRRHPSLAHHGDEAWAQLELGAGLGTVDELPRTVDTGHVVVRGIGEDRLIRRARRQKRIQPVVILHEALSFHPCGCKRASKSSCKRDINHIR